MFKGMMVRLMGLTMLASNVPLITNIDKMHTNMCLPVAMVSVFAILFGTYFTLKCN